MGIRVRHPEGAALSTDGYVCEACVWPVRPRPGMHVLFCNIIVIWATFPFRKKRLTLCP